MVSPDPPPPRRRRTRPVVLAGAAVLLAGVATAVAVAGRDGGPAAAPAASPAAAPATAPGELRRLGPLHPYPPVPKATEDPVTGKRRRGGALGPGPLFAVGAGRTLTAWVTADNMVTAGGADVTTGAALWPPRRLGRFPGLLSVRSAPGALVVGVRGSKGDVRPDGTGRPPPGGYRFTLLVLDPATGRTRWTVDNTEAGMLMSDDTLVVSKPSGAVAYDLLTGRKRWRTGPLDHAQAETFESLHPDPDRPGTFHRPPVLSTDGRFHLLDDDGTLQTRDLRTGAVLSTLHLGPYGRVLLAGGTVYWTTPPVEAGRELWAATLAAAGRPRRLLTAQPGRWLGNPAVCGTGRVCIGESGRDDTSVVRALRASDGATLWSRSGLDTSFPYLGDHGETVKTGSARDGRGRVQGVGLLAPDGRDLLTGEHDSTVLIWYDRDTLLSIDGTTVATVAAADARRTVVGHLPPGVDVFSCEVATGRLICPAGPALGIWSLTGA